jgi:hypothetical protein
MALPTGSIYEIRWKEICPWLVLAKAWRVSLLVRVLAYSWAGLLLTQWGWHLCMNSWSDVDQSERVSVNALDLTEGISLPGLDASERRLLRLRSLAQTGLPTSVRATRTARSEPHPLAWLRLHLAEHSFGPFIEGWRALSRPFVKAFQFDASVGDVVRLLVCGLWGIAVWAIFGSAIARTSARYCTREEIITPIGAGRAALTKWPSTAGAALIPLLIAGVLVLPLALIGLLMRADTLAMFAGFFWLLSLVWGFGIAVVLIAVWFGWPLMWATVAVERSDAFDAASRTAAYVYQRPLRLIFYVIVASLLGVVGHLLVAGFTAAASYLADWSVSWGSGAERFVELAAVANNGVEPPLSGSEAFASAAIGFWKSMLASLSASYPLAYLFSASVGIYLLLRMDIDATEMDEITVDAGEDTVTHEPHLDEANAAGVN